MQQIRHSFLSLAFTANLLFWASIAVTPAIADLVTFQFSGTVVSGTDDLPGLATGKFDTMTGSLTYNNSFTPDSDGNPKIGSYGTSVVGPITALTVTFNGGYSVTLDTTPPATANNVTILTDTGANALGTTLPAQSYAQAFFVLAGMKEVNGEPPDNGFPAVGNYQPSNFQMAIYYDQPVFGNSDALTTPSLANFIGYPSARAALQFHGNDGFSQINMVLTAVPLPPAVILFGAGLVALVGLGAGNWRQRKRAD